MTIQGKQWGSSIGQEMKLMQCSSKMFILTWFVAPKYFRIAPAKTKLLRLPSKLDPK